MAFVPQGTGKGKDGKPFTYGGYVVDLITCAECDGVYASGDRVAHDASPWHAKNKRLSTRA